VLKPEADFHPEILWFIFRYSKRDWFTTRLENLGVNRITVAVADLARAGSFLNLNEFVSCRKNCNPRSFRNKYARFAGACKQSQIRQPNPPARPQEAISFARLRATAQNSLIFSD
jgi:hypothetical protein